ncbi:MAG: hypothetical protein FJY48_11705 [Betaproteobacteria bacterium]|nr:hypothetical protein [Betaproteobacteria bacterium]
MRLLLLTVALAATSYAAPPEAFWRALHHVESSGRRGGLILGDEGRSRGPLQIMRGYHADSRVAGAYEQVDDLAYSRRVVTAYLKRYAPKAWAEGDVETLARVHNGGPRGASKPQTKAYAARVRRAMQ